MCVILYLKPGQRIDFEKLKNATLNNPDGFGIVSLDFKGKIDVFRDVREKGNDPDFVMEKLEDGKELARFLHVRKNTVGDTNLENAHPFEVYNSQKLKHQIYFMHNGTLHEYKPSVADKSGKSDSRIFSESVVSPMLYHFMGDHGMADIEDPWFEKIMNKFFIGMNRGVLISNKKSPLFLGKWETVKDATNGDFLASNDDYFDRTIEVRMNSSMRSGWPVQNPTIPEKAPESNVIALPSPGANKDVVPLKDIDLSPKFSFLEPKDLKNLYDTGGSEITDDDLSYISLVGLAEFNRFCTDEPANAAKLLDFMASRYAELFKEYEKIAEKHEKASKMIENLKFENNELQKYSTPVEDA